MKVYTRKVIKGSKNKNSYTITLPLEIIKKYQLQDSTIIITDEDDIITICKTDQIIKTTTKETKKFLTDFLLTNVSSYASFLLSLLTRF